MPKKIKKAKKRDSKKFKSHPEEKSSQEQTPVFSCEYLDGDYWLLKCDKNHQAAFAKTIHKLSKITWAEIFQNNRHGVGYEKIEPKKIKAQIPEPALGKTIIAFRYSGKSPMVGFRQKRVFYVLWLDRDFSLYSH